MFGMITEAVSHDKSMFELLNSVSSNKIWDVGVSLCFSNERFGY